MTGGHDQWIANMMALWGSGKGEGAHSLESWQVGSSLSDSRGFGRGGGGALRWGHQCLLVDAPCPGAPAAGPCPGPTPAIQREPRDRFSPPADPRAAVASGSPRPPACRLYSRETGPDTGLGKPTKQPWSEWRP